MNYLASPDETDTWTDCNNQDFEFWYRNQGHECLHPTADFFCEEGYKYYEKTAKCYKFFDEKKTWEEADSDCMQLSGHLASAADNDTNVFLHNIMKGDAYIGG